MSQDVLISASGLKKYFPIKGFLGGKTRYLKAVDGVDLEIFRGETFGLVGESGCGKSTLGRTLIGMMPATGGTIRYKGEDPAEHRQSMQIIFQDPYSALDPYWNIEEILEEPLKRTKMTEKERKERVSFLMEKVGMNPEDLQKFPYEFSGGQRQRIGIARALAVQPEFILCDEPIAALDVSIQAQIVNMLEDLQEEFGLTYLFAAHDLSMVRYISRRIGVMYLGSLVEVAESRALYEAPLHPYTKALLSAVPVADPKKAALKKRILLKGELPNPMDVPAGCAFAPRCPFAVSRCSEERPELKMYAEGHFAACYFASGRG